jgi:hypothetical protein
MLKMKLLFRHLKQIDTVEVLGINFLISQVNMFGTTFKVTEVIVSLLLSNTVQFCFC